MVHQAEVLSPILVTVLSLRLDSVEVCGLVEGVLERVNILRSLGIASNSWRADADISSLFDGTNGAINCG